MVDFVQEGLLIDYVNGSGSDIAYGDAVVVNDQTFVAAEAIADGETGALRTEGVFEFVAATGDTFSVGDLVYYDVSEEAITATATGNIPCGWITEAKVSGTLVAYVKLGREFVEADSAAATMVGTLASLTTTDKTDAVSAINELDADLASAVTYASDESTIVLSAATTSQTATITLKDLAGATIEAVQKIQAYMCTDSAGATPSSAGSNGNVTATTGAILKAITAKLHFDIVTDVNGVAVLSFDNTGGSTYTNRVVLVLPSGGVVVSDALAVLGA